MTKKIRTLRIEVEEDIVKKVEEQFCFAHVKGESSKIRTISSVAREAFLRGIIQMSMELKELRKKHGPDIYLDDGGVNFAGLKELTEDGGKDSK